MLSALTKPCPACGVEFTRAEFTDHDCDPRECEACGDVHSQPEACPAYFDGAAALHHAIANGGAL